MISQYLGIFILCISLSSDEVRSQLTQSPSSNSIHQNLIDDLASAECSDPGCFQRMTYDLVEELTLLEEDSMEDIVIIAALQDLQHRFVNVIARLESDLKNLPEISLNISNIRIGATGATGPSGAIGPEGQLGVHGQPGPPGQPGNTGPTGTMGPTGVPGPYGPVGIGGAMGATGPTGRSGATGATGSTGLRGVPGPPGGAG